MREGTGVLDDRISRVVAVSLEGGVSAELTAPLCLNDAGMDSVTWMP